MRWTDTVDPMDDLFHPRIAHPYWNEASLNTFYVPERNLHGIIYVFFRPNMQMVVGGPILTDDRTTELYNTVHYAWDQYMPMPDGCEMVDYTLPNGLSMRTIELQKRYGYTYSA